MRPVPKSSCPRLAPALRRALVATATALAAATLSAGCSSVDSEGRLRHEEIAVEPSGLNNATFLYDPAPGNPLFRHPVRVELIGTGMASFCSGPSPQVRDSFSVDSEHPDWNRLVRDNATFTQSEMADVFQIFVDEGLVPTRRTSPSRVGAPVLQFAGTLENRKFSGATDNTVLIAAFEDFVREFFPRGLEAASRLKRTQRAGRGEGER